MTSSPNYQFADALASLESTRKQIRLPLQQFQHNLITIQQATSMVNKSTTTVAAINRQLNSIYTSDFKRAMQYQAQLARQYQRVAKLAKTIRQPILPLTAISTQQAGTIKQLNQVMKPFLASHNVELTSKSNELIQNFSSHPSESLRKFVDVSTKTSQVVTNKTDPTFRETPTNEKNSQNQGNDRGSSNGAISTIDNTLQEFKNSDNVDCADSKDTYAWIHDPKKCLEYFLYFCQFLIFLYTMYAIQQGQDTAETLITQLIDGFLAILEKDGH